MNVIKRLANGTVAVWYDGNLAGLGLIGPIAWGINMECAFREHYRRDARRITSAEQDRIAREYRARCAEEDAR